MDGSFNRHRSKVGFILEGHNGVAMAQSLCFKFKPYAIRLNTRHSL